MTRLVVMASVGSFREADETFDVRRGFRQLVQRCDETIWPAPYDQGVAVIRNALNLVLDTFSKPDLTVNEPPEHFGGLSFSEYFFTLSGQNSALYSNYCGEANEVLDLLTASEESETAVTALNTLIDRTIRIVIQAVDSWEATARRNVITQMAARNPELDSQLSTYRIRFRDELESVTRQSWVARTALQNWDLARSTDRARLAANRAQSAASSADRAAGRSADSTLDAYYSRYATSEGWRSAGWRLAAIALLATFTVVAILTSASSDTAALVHRGLIALGVLSLSGYFASEAARHRRTATWAKTLSIQLLTIEAYCKTVEDDAGMRIRELFAARVFGPGPTHPQDESPVNKLVDQVTKQQES